MKNVEMQLKAGTGHRAQGTGAARAEGGGQYILSDARLESIDKKHV